MRIGFVVNPIAGMGGRVGLKGTDGVVDEARKRGAEPRATDRAIEALESLREWGNDVTIVTPPGVLGAEAAAAAGFDPEVPPDIEEKSLYETTAEDTQVAVRTFIDRDVDLVLFVGGDGTAVDVAKTLDEVGTRTPMLGVPAGVKVYSSVFGVTPGAAGRIAATFDGTEEREVVDLDEEAYRDGEVRTRLHAVVSVPVAEDLQASKQLASGSIEGLAAGVVDEVDPDVAYILGPGSTVGAIKRALGFEGSPLGVDVWRDGEVIVRDGAESDILDALGERNVIIVSPIGGQGFVFGRGNQQLSPAVIERSEIVIVASKRKLDETGVLRVDTGDPALDEELRGWQRVRVGRFEHRMMQVK